MLNIIPMQLLGHALAFCWDRPTPTNEIPRCLQSTRTTATLLVVSNMMSIPVSQFYALLTSGREFSKLKSSLCLQLPPQILRTAFPTVKVSNSAKRMQPAKLRLALRLRGGKDRKLIRKCHGTHLI